MPELTAGILVYDNVEALDFAGPYEVLSAARLPEAPEYKDPCPFSIHIVSEYPRPVKVMGGMKVVPDSDMERCPHLDILIVPGGLGERWESNNHVIQYFLRTRSRTVKTLASVCTGAFFLGKSGLLDGRKATTHHLSLDRLRDACPETEVVAGERFVEDGDIITSAGISAGIDMTLYIVSKHLGEESARITAELMEYPYPS